MKDSAQDANEIESLRALLRAVDQVWRALAASAEMGTAEVVALEQLHFTSPLPSRQIGERTGLTPAGVTGLLDRFEERGLVQRVRPPENRRLVLAELTETGRELTTELFSSLVTMVEQAAKDIDVPELTVRVQCLDYTAELLHRAATQATSADTSPPLRHRIESNTPTVVDQRK